MASHSAAPLCSVSDARNIQRRLKIPLVTVASHTDVAAAVGGGSPVEMRWAVRCQGDGLRCGLSYGGEQHGEITQVCWQTVAGQYRTVTLLPGGGGGGGGGSVHCQRRRYTLCANQMVT